LQQWQHLVTKTAFSILFLNDNMSEPMNKEMMSDEINRLQQEIFFLQRKLNAANTALELIAAPKRGDGTYNRCREACETLAKEALSHSRL
jgi:hypothetical protein